MKRTISIAMLFLAVTFTACNQETKTEAPKADAQPKATMSEKTELKAAPAEDKDYTTIKLPTSICETCEETITKAVKAVNGTIDVKVNTKEHFAKVKFDAKKTDLQKIRIAISKAGYDADNVKRDEKAFEKLPACCKSASAMHS